MTKQILTDIECSIEWKSPFASHTDIFYLQRINLNKDKLPLDFADQVAALNIGESYSQTVRAKELLGEEYSSSKMITFDSKLFDSEFKGKHSPPILYRFYPKAIAWQGLDSFITDYAPFRLISINEDELVGDTNHPLSVYYLSLTVRKLKQVGAANEKPARDIGKLITAKGPGMQAPFEYGDPVFFAQYPFEIKADETIAKPHLDKNALAMIAKLYKEQLPQFSKVLDLNSGPSSYLADDYKTGMLTGIAPCETQLSQNQRLDTYQIQNLNTDTTMLFEKDSFDDAICTLAIQNFIDPLKIMQEIARVVVKGGKFIVTFSDSVPNRNTISLWGQLHPFERMQLVLEYFRQSELFEEIETYSGRGALRAKDEVQTSRKRLSDPIFAVWGKVK